MIGQLVVMLIPPLLYASIVLTDLEDLRLTTSDLRRQLSDVCFFMAAACLLITPVLGAIPLIGAIPDFFFRSNSRNLRIIKRHLDKHHPGSIVVEGQVNRR